MCSIDTVKLCSNCWSLHLFGIAMRFEGVPRKSLKFFLGTNQFRLRIPRAGKHIALTSLRVLSMEIVLSPTRIRISICYNFVTCICMPLKLRVMSVFHINFPVKIRFPREVIIWDF